MLAHRRIPEAGDEPDGRLLRRAANVGDAAFAVPLVTSDFSPDFFEQRVGRRILYDCRSADDELGKRDVFIHFLNPFLPS